MDWPKGSPIVWHPYRLTSGGNHLAALYLRFNYQGTPLLPRRFIFDSGAVKTIAPVKYAIDPLDLSKYPPENTGMKDVHGNPLTGVPIPLELEIEGEHPAEHLYLQETVWFCEGVCEGLLGQASVFEQLGVLFENFPDAPAGRRFGLYRPPGSMETLSFHTPGTWLYEGTGTATFINHEFIVLEGGPGLYRYTGGEYTDFDLEVGWYTESPQGRASVCLRIPAAGTALTPDSRAGIEIPLEAQNSDDTWREALSMPGAWNTLTIQVSEREVHIRLNEVKVRTLEVSAHETGAGFIGLRSYPGSQMVFRAPRLRRR